LGGRKRTTGASGGGRGSQQHRGNEEGKASDRRPGQLKTIKSKEKRHKWIAYLGTEKRLRCERRRGGGASFEAAPKGGGSHDEFRQKKKKCRSLEIKSGEWGSKAIGISTGKKEENTVVYSETKRVWFSQKKCGVGVQNSWVQTCLPGKKKRGGAIKAA